MRELLERAKRGETQAKTELFQILQGDLRVKRTIRSLAYDRSIVDSDDAKQEFWVGVIRGMRVVKPHMGDPILHLIKRGVWQVKSVVKQELNKRVVQTCTDCNRNNPKYAYDRRCKYCGEVVENLARYVDIDGLRLQSEYLDSISSVTIVKLTRVPSPRQIALLECLFGCVIAGSEAPLSDCAKFLGISKQRVSQHLNELRPSLILT